MPPGQLGAIQAVAPSFGVEVTPIDVIDAPEIERAITAFAQAPNGGAITQTNSSFGTTTVKQGNRVIQLAVKFYF